MESALVYVGVVIFVGLSAIYSGLNIALMSLSREDLRRKASLGDVRAARVLPFRENSHLALGAILFANVAAVSANALFLERHLDGLIAGILSTVLMVIFGEVLPQAIFVKSALKFCSFFTPLLWVTMIVTYPFAKPLQYLLDILVGKEKTTLHSRAELGMLISEHATDESSDLDEDEVEIIRSTLQLSEKRVQEIMRPIEEVFYLLNTDTLDERTVDNITSQGYSRVPVFNIDMTVCDGVLLMKDMVDIDFDEQPRLVGDFKLHRTELVGSRTALDTALRKFFSLKTHLIPIEKDDKVVGIVTVEDLVEEIIGHEIADETDRAHNRT